MREKKGARIAIGPHVTEIGGSDCSKELHQGFRLRAAGALTLQVS